MKLALCSLPSQSGYSSFMPIIAFSCRFDAEIEDSPTSSLIARLLCRAVDPAAGDRRREDTLKRVRGRIDILKTESRNLFRRGEIACRFEELTIDTPRNRLVRAALTVLGGWLDDKDLAHRTRTLAGSLGRAGVSGLMPSRAETASDQIARHESEDQLMVSLLAQPSTFFCPRRRQERVRSLKRSAILRSFASSLKRRLATSSMPSYLGRKAGACTQASRFTGQLARHQPVSKCISPS